MNTNMTFSDETIKIENPVYAVRFNGPDGNSPLTPIVSNVSHGWNLNAKSVHSEKGGIFGIPFNANRFKETGMFGSLTDNIANPEYTIILLEADRKDIFINSPYSCYKVGLMKYDRYTALRKEMQKKDFKDFWGSTERFLWYYDNYREICLSKANIIASMPGTNNFLPIIMAAVENNRKHGRRDVEGMEYEPPSIIGKIPTIES